MDSNKLNLMRGMITPEVTIVQCKLCLRDGPWTRYVSYGKPSNEWTPYSTYATDGVLSIYHGRVGMILHAVCPSCFTTEYTDLVEPATEPGWSLHRSNQIATYRYINWIRIDELVLFELGSEGQIALECAFRRLAGD